MNKNIDELIESALANDSNRLPKQQEMPGAGLLAKLSSTPTSVASTSTVTASAGIGFSKLLMLIASVAVVGTAWFIYFRSTDTTPKTTIPEIPKTIETVPLQSSDSTKPTIADIKKKFVADSSKVVVKKDSVQSKPHSMDDDLIHPTTPPRKYNRDSVNVPIHAK